MRKIPLVLASLALAAVVTAQTSATTTTTTDVTLGANANLQQLGLYQEPYHVFSDGTDQNESDSRGGTLTLGDSSSTNHGGDGLTTFSATATATATLDSPDYSAVPSGGPGYDLRFQGYRFYLTLKNLTDVDQAVSFHVGLDISVLGSAASPYGIAQFDGNGDLIRPGALAASEFVAGVVDKSIDDDLSNVAHSSISTYYNGSVPVPTYDISHYLIDFDANYTLPAAQVHTYEIYAGSVALAEFVPVPEPSAFAALAIGALALLRRRARKA